MSPLVTLDTLPTKDESGADVTWRPMLLSTLQTVARETAALVSRVSTEGGQQAVDCWYAAPGATDAVGVDVLDTFVRKPYYVGRYYLRVRTGAGADAYYRCEGTEGGDANARFTEANIDARRIESLLSELAEERARNAKIVEENTGLRAHVNDVLDREAKIKRELAEVQAQLTGAEEAANPMLDTESVGTILAFGDKALKEYVDGGDEGRAQGLLGHYFTSDFHLSGRIAADVDVMTLVITRYGPEWNAKTEAFNLVSATLAKAEGRPAAHALPDVDRVRLCLPAARLSAREERQRELEDAERIVAKHKAKGRGGSAAAKRSGARANGAAKRAPVKARGAVGKKA